MKHDKHLPVPDEVEDASASPTEQAAEPVLFEEAPAEPDALTLALQAIDALRAENADLKDRTLRTLAEMENLRKRTEREKAEATLYAATNFASDLLSVADNFSRAIAAVTEEQRADAITGNLLAGVEVTERELLNIFERHGIKRMDPIGRKFDPTMHQAMLEIPSADQAPGTVVQVLQAGYAIGERCLRPALVAVAKAAEPASSS